MDFDTPHAQPSNAEAEEGQVLVDGPDGIAFTMTPEAAEETGRRMQAAALAARGQREITRRQA